MKYNRIEMVILEIGVIPLPFNQQTICERRTYTDFRNTHAHDFYQLLLPLQGSLHIETNERNIQLNEEHLFLLPPDARHKFYSKERNEFLVLDIPLHRFSTVGCSTVEEEKHLVLDERWKAIRSLFLYDLQDSDMLHQRINDDLLQYATGLFKEDSKRDVSIQYIHDHYGESISMQTLANLEHYNPSYYSQWFREKMGTTPKVYIQRLRLSQAKKLLESTELSILQITQQVGYEHHSSLTRLFQQFEGITPNAYRNIYQKDKENLKNR
jgi:YesN/AraC family two-component response regulator